MAATEHRPEECLAAPSGMPEVAIRDATAADATAIAGVNIDSAREAYRGILPEHVLEGFSQEEMAAQFVAAFDQLAAQGYFCLVADDPRHGVVGFLLGGPESTGDAAFTGEVVRLYLAPAQQRRGLGRRLLSAGARRLAQRGYRSLLIWTFTANAPGRRFYESLGGEAVRERELELFGVKMPETAYGWRDTGMLFGEIGQENDSAAGTR